MESGVLSNSMLLVGSFFGKANFFQSKVRKTENDVISERLYNTRNYVYPRLENVD